MKLLLIDFFVKVCYAHIYFPVETCFIRKYNLRLYYNPCKGKDINNSTTLGDFTMAREYIKRHWLTLLGIAIGALGGFLYWKFIGCTTGTCPITSSPINSSIWGSIIGGLLFSSFQKENKVSTNKDK